MHKNYSFIALVVGLVLLTTLLLLQKNIVATASNADTAGNYLPIILGALPGPTITPELPSNTPTNTPTPSTSPESTGTAVPTNTPTIDPEVTSTNTPQPSATPTSTPQPSNTPTNTPTPNSGGNVTKAMLTGSWDFYNPSSNNGFPCLKWNLCSDGSYVNFYDDGTLFIFKYYDPQNGEPIIERSRTGVWTILNGVVTINYNDGIEEAHVLQKNGDANHIKADAVDVNRLSFMKKGSASPGYMCEFTLLDKGPNLLGPATTTRQDEKVLIAGGYREVWYENPSDNIYIFDGSTRKFTQVARTESKYHHSAVTLHDGRILLIPGGDDPIEIYSPDTNKLTTTESDLYCHAAPYVFSDNEVLFVCEYDQYVAEQIAQVYNPETDEVRSFEAETFGWRYGSYPTALSVPYTNESALVTDGFLVTVFDKWGSATVGSDYLGGNVTYSNIALSFDNKKVYQTGGYNDFDYVDDVFYKDAFVMDLSTYKGRRIADLLQPRADHSLIGLPGGNMVAIGGFYKEDYISAVELYDVENNKWFDSGNLNIARTGPEVVLLANGEILVIGGLAGTEGSHYIPPPEIGTCKKPN